MFTTREKFLRRRKRVRFALKKNSLGSLRLSVFRSGKNMYAQLINDKEGRTLASVSSLEKPVLSLLKEKGVKGSTVAGSFEVGKLMGSRILELGFSGISFDRGGYKYHGRVKSFADGARSAGLNF